MKLSRSAVCLMNAVRIQVSNDRPWAEDFTREQLNLLRQRVARLDSEQPFSKGSRISLSLRRARARDELNKWTALCVELEITV